jgi:hypothetical protein
VASKILSEAPRTLFLAQDLKRILAGRSFDVCIFESLAIQSIIVAPSSTRLVDSVNLVFVNHTTYLVAVTNFGDYSSFQVAMPWYVVTAVCIEGSYGFLGVSPYVCVVTHSCHETHKAIISVNLKAIALSGSELVCYDQLLPFLCIHDKVFSRSLSSSTLLRAAL